MAKKSYAENINTAEMMQSGLRNNSERAAKRGLDKEFMEKLSLNLKSTVALNIEQERLKAELKLKTAALDTQLKALNKQVSEARKIVKIEFQKEQWKEFGIEAKM